MADGTANLRPVRPGESSPAVTHGCYALAIPSRARELADDLRALLPAHSAADDPTVALAATVLSRIEAANLWLDEYGIFANAKGAPQPILKALSTWENTAARLLDRLGMTPTARATLGLHIARAHEAGLADLIEEGRLVRERAGSS